MIDWLVAQDKDAMVLLNLASQHSVGLDFFFWMISQIAIWIPVLLAFIFVLAKDKGKEAFLIVGVVVLLFLLCDQVSSSVLKPLIARPRPSHDPSVSEMLGYVFNYRGGAFGFPSSHAANSFGFAVFSALLFRHRLYTCVALTWATLCAYSRIYLGVHYPGDILVGTVIGIAIGFLCHSLYQYLRRRFFAGSLLTYPLRTSPVMTATGYRRRDISLIILILAVLLFAIACCGWEIHRHAF